MTKTNITILRTVQQVRQWRKNCFVHNYSVGFVPTMGALHQGHTSLVTQSLLENDKTIVSIFVNPSQFGPNEDLDKYPRTLDSDLNILTQMFQDKPIDAVFVPKISEMYPSGINLDVSKQKGAFVTVLGCSEQLEGVTRPGFFRGVATVVTKLLNVVLPTNIYFGQKDAQQCVVIKNLVKDLLYDTTVRIMPTQREPNGLALSSRNAYLSPQIKRESAIIFQALSSGEAFYNQQKLNKSSTPVNAHDIYSQVYQTLSNHPHFTIEYIAISHPDTLEDLQFVEPGVGAILSTAVRVPKQGSDQFTRLIDNVVLT